VLTSPFPRSRHLDLLYECGGCGDRLLNERRCDSCNRFTRRLGLAVMCSNCDEPLLLAELLEQLGLEVAGLR
jgi:predicted SprT family Zn-dependent metalloprotease